MKRFILFLVSIFLVSFPRVVHASESVVAIGDQFYASLGEAVQQVKSGETIQLLEDLDLRNQSSTVYTFPDNVTLDLSNHKIITKNMGAIYTGIRLTIQNGSFETDGSYALFIGDYVDTDQVLVKNVTTVGGINIFNATNVVLEDVSSVGHTYYSVWADEHAQISILSGTYQTEGNYVIGISSEESSYIYIEGGNFITTNDNLVLKGDSQDPLISGGVFDTDPTEYLWNNARIIKEASGKYYVGYETTVQLPEVNNDTKVEVVDLEYATKVLKDYSEKLNIKNKNLVLQVSMEELELTASLEQEIQQAISDPFDRVQILDLFDISIQIQDEDTHDVVAHLSELDHPMKFQIPIPEISLSDDLKQTYYILRKHENKITILETTLSDDGKFLMFESDQFSPYALVSVEQKLEEEKKDEEDMKEDILDIENPKTNDSLSHSIFLFGISFSILSFTLLKKYM